MLFWHRFLVDLGSISPNLLPQTLQNPRKIDAKSLSILDFKFRSIFDRFWLPTWTPRTSFGASGLAPNGIFRIFRKPHVGCDFGANLAPFSSPKSTKIQKKSIPRCIKFWIDFSTDFSSMLARFWRPTWSHVGHLFLPRAVQNGPQHPPKATKTAKSLKNLENDPQKPIGYPSRPRFWSQHGCIWDHLGHDFGLFLDLDLGPILFIFSRF